MPGQADGSIIVDTEIDPEGFRAGSAELQRAIKSLSTTVNNLGSMFQKALGGNERAIESFRSKAAALEETISQLEAKMEGLGTQAVPTEQYAAITAEIKKQEAAFDKMLNKQDKMLALDVSQESAGWKSLQYDIEACGEKIRQLAAEKEKMEKSGTAYQKGAETAEYQQMAAQLEAAKQKLGDMKGRLEQSSGEASRLSSHAQSFSSHIGNAARTITGKLVSGIRSAAGSMWRMVTHSRSMSGQFGSLISGAQRFAIGLLGAEGVLTLLRRAVGAYMAENQQLANTLSSCWSGIGNILGPIISWIINLVSTAVAYVTAFLQLFGIVGKSTVKAISGAGNAAAGAAKELKRQLASFDELNILNDNSSGGGGGGGGGGGAGIDGGLPDVELPDWAKLMAEQIKNGEWYQAGETLGTALNGLIDNFDWAGWGKRLGTGIQNGISFALGFIRTTHWEGLGAGIATFLNNAIDSINPNDLGALLASKIRIAVDMAYGFVTTFNWVNFGEWLGGIVNGWFSEIDWGKAAKTLSIGIIGVLKSAVAFLKTTDWKQVGADIGEFISGIEWGEIFSGLWDALCAIGEAFLDVLDGLHDGLGGIATIVEAIAIGFAGWKIASGVTGALDKIFGLFGKKTGAEKGFQIPSPKTILKGFADLAIIIGGAAALIEALGLLMKIPGFEDTARDGLKALGIVFNGIAAVALPLAGLSAAMVALGKIGVSSVAKGLAGMAIILDGIPIVITALGALLSIPYFSEFLGTGVESVKSVFNGLGEVALPIGVLSAILIGLGIATPGVILSGLIGFAAVIGGLEIVLVALGALNQIPGFSWIVGEGGKVLMQLGEILGGFAGSIVNGFLTSVSDAFPKIADNLSSFAQKLEPFLSVMGEVDAGVADAAKNLALAIMAFSGASLVDAVTSWITGGKSLVDFGEQLAEFGPLFKEYADSISGIDPAVVEASANAASAMVSLAKEIPGSGGILQWIMGEQDIGKFGAQLNVFGKCFAEYAKNTDGINPEVVAASANAAQAMIELAQQLPSQGGVLQWLMGSQDMGAFGSQLKMFGECFVEYSKYAENIKPEVVSASVNAAQALIALAQDIPTSGGFMAWLFGGNDMGTFGNNLKLFGESFKGYYESISGVEFSKVNTANATLRSLIEVTGQMKDVDTGKVKEFGKAVKDLGEKLSGTNWSSVSGEFSSGMSTMLTSLNTTITGMKTAMSGLESDLTTTWQDIVTNASTKWEDIRTTIGTANDSIKTDSSKKWGDIKKALELSWDGIKTTAKTKFELIRGEIKGAWEKVAKDTTENWKTICTTVTNKVDEIKETTRDGFDKVKDNIVGKTAGAMTEVTKQNWYSVGAYIVSGIIAGINDSAWRISTTMSNLARNALNSAKSSLGINSPSRLFRDEVGQFIGLGIGAGIEDSQPAVMKSVAGVADAIEKEMNAGDYTIKSIVPTAETNGALSNFADKISDSFAGLMDRLQAIAERVTFQIPVAAGGMVPYRAAATVTGGGADFSSLLDTSNDELISAMTQIALNTTNAIVTAIESNCNVNVNFDERFFVQKMIDGIKRRSNMAGRFLLDR